MNLDEFLSTYEMPKEQKDLMNHLNKIHGLTISTMNEQLSAVSRYSASNEIVLSANNIYGIIEIKLRFDGNITRKK